MIVATLRELLKIQTKETTMLHRRLLLTQEAARNALVTHVPSQGIKDALQSLDAALEKL